MAKELEKRKRCHVLCRLFPVGYQNTPGHRLIAPSGSVLHQVASACQRLNMVFNRVAVGTGYFCGLGDCYPSMITTSRRAWGDFPYKCIDHVS